QGSLVNLIWQTHLGIKGLIQNEDGKMIFNATIKVYQAEGDNWKYIDHDVTSNIGGDYYRLLVDGSYAVEVSYPGFKSQTQYVDVNYKSQQTDAQRLDFILESVSSKRSNLRKILSNLFNKY
ncbi:unnamed protein product, partial [Adineta steineri]